MFELKRKTYRGQPVCVLGIRPDDNSWNETHFVQVDERGCCEGPYARSTTRFAVHALHPRDLTTRLVAGRRQDLERFDGDDLALIRYGCHIEFGGRIRTCITRAHLPPMPGRRWTVFWTKAKPFAWEMSGAERTLQALLQGHWHLNSHCGGDWRFGRDSRLEGWATTDTDPGRLRRIEAHLRHHLPHLEVQVIEMAATDYGDRVEIKARGLPCPVVYAGGTTTIWPNGGWGFSVGG